MNDSPATREGIIDGLTQGLGAVAAWCTIVMAAITALVVVMRYIFGEGSIALQESITYLHSAVFMLGAGYALKHGAHVRVDIFYNRFSPVTQAWVDAVGMIVFVLPLCVFTAAMSWDYVVSAWDIREASSDPGGLPYVYLLKLLIPIMAFSLMLQALAELTRLTRKLMHWAQGDNVSG